jgi:dTDP-glucose 4,6-dehydratase
VHADNELPNIEVLRKLAHILGVPEEKAFIAIPNRVGQDIRYSLDDSRIRSLGWKPSRDFDKELRRIAVEDDFKRFV